MIDHEAIRQSVAAYTLDALSHDEQERVQRELLDHLPGCASCTELLRDFRDAVADLAIGVPPMALSDDLEQRVLDVVRGDHASPVPVVSRRRRLAVRAAAAIAAAALAASLTTTAVLLGDAGRQDRARARIAAALTVVGDPGSRVGTLQGGKGTVLVAVGLDGRVAMIADGLPEAPEGRVLELWLFSYHKPVPIAVFTPREGAAVVLASIPPGEYAAAAITYEREMVPAPTSTPAYQGSI